MILLVDRYHQGSLDLQASLEAAGYAPQTIVIETDGFLPAGILSPFTYYVEEPDEAGKPLFFDQVPVPAFWEITGDNQSAKISDLMEERARIHYASQTHARLVKTVEWLNKAGFVRQTDHYNRFGFCFAKTTHDQAGLPIFTQYVTRLGQERIMENHVTGDILLTLEDEPIRHFANRTAFVRDFLQRVVDLDQPILFNSLSTAFLASYNLPGRPGQDLLVWQEPLGDALPGNMLLILEDNDLRANRVAIPDRATYERARALVPKEQAHKLIPLGYIYPFARDNFIRKDALIATNSDQIAQLETIVEALPEVTFRIAAVTEMSPKLLSMLRYPNVVLYQNASQQKLTELYAQADIYLDINYANELQGAVRRAFENNMLILAFQETAHNLTYTAPAHRYSLEQTEQLIDQIREATSDAKGMQAALAAQGFHANYMDRDQFAGALSPIIGGDHGKR